MNKSPRFFEAAGAPCPPHRVQPPRVVARFLQPIFDRKNRTANRPTNADALASLRCHASPSRALPSHASPDRAAPRLTAPLRPAMNSQAQAARPPKRPQGQPRHPEGSGLPRRATPDRAAPNRARPSLTRPRPTEPCQATPRLTAKTPKYELSVQVVRHGQRAHGQAFFSSNNSTRKRPNLGR